MQTTAIIESEFQYLPEVLAVIVGGDVVDVNLIALLLNLNILEIKY